MDWSTTSSSSMPNGRCWPISWRSLKRPTFRWAPASTSSKRLAVAGKINRDESGRGNMNRIVRRYLTVGFGCGAVLLALQPSYAGQAPPPVDGTIALEGTVDETYKAANTVIV